MNFESIDKIIKEFNLNTDDPKEIQKQLRNLLVDIHPDKNGGEFSSPEISEKYFKIKSALEFIDTQNEKQTAMVPVTAITDIAKMIRDIIPANQAESADTILSSKIDSRLVNINTHYSFTHSTPKITTAAITTIVTALLAFPTAATENPYIKIIIENNFVSLSNLPNIWLGSLVLAGIVWYRYSYIESQEKIFNSSLKLESVQNKLFDEFIRSSDFTKDDFVNFLMYPKFQGIKSRLFSRLARILWEKIPWFYEFFFQRPDVIEPEIAQQLADVIFSRAESRCVIKKESKASLSEHYRLS